MNNNDLISIIVPIYNVEKYLDKCISSIVNQSYKNLEIILINDGSSDRCGEICNEWAKKDSRICVYHQKNSGVSVARNVGLKNMNGFYFTCIDPDDFWHCDYIKEMLTGAKTSNADLIFCGLTDINESNDIISFMNRPRELLTGNRINEYIWGSFGYVIGGVCKLFKTSIVKENHLSYIQELTNGEDWVFLNDYLKYCSSVFHIGKTLYYCLKRNNSLSSNFSKEKFSNTLVDLWNKIKDTENPQKKFKPWDIIRLQVSIVLLVNYYRHKKAKDLTYFEIQKFIKNNRISFIIYGKMTYIRKLKLSFKLFFPKIYLGILK